MSGAAARTLFERKKMTRTIYRKEKSGVWKKLKPTEQ